MTTSDIDALEHLCEREAHDCKKEKKGRKIDGNTEFAERRKRKKGINALLLLL